MAREKNLNKNKQSHSANVEREAHGMMDKIHELLKVYEYDKAQNSIEAFLKKYEKEDYAKDRVHLYYALKDTILNFKEI